MLWKKKSMTEINGMGQTLAKDPSEGAETSPIPMPTLTEIIDVILFHQQKRLYYL